MGGRRFADDLETSAEEAEEASQINRISEEEGARWLHSFLPTDKRKTYCLYEAPLADAIRRVAERAGLPAHAVVEVGGMVWHLAPPLPFIPADWIGEPGTASGCQPSTAPPMTSRRAPPHGGTRPPGTPP
jgi:hypothetical protein